MNPFTESAEKSVSGFGEKRILAKIRDWLGASNSPTPYGMGDDCAVLPIGETNFNLITSDSLVYGQHFDDTVLPEDAGAKLLNRSVSDIASMGGRPSGAVVNLFLAPAVHIDWLRGFYAGIEAAASKAQVKILGGDLCATDGLVGASVTVWGEAPRPITREGARVGDAIMVTGSLGGSIRGKHFRFTPRVEEGSWLASDPYVHSMIDLSDGMGKDLPELVPDGCVAALRCKGLPASEDANILAAKTGRTVLSHILDDGEDFELLFTLDPACSIPRFIDSWRERFTTGITHIGTISYAAASGALVIDSDTGCPISVEAGYEHLRES
jgi:thiamine-monophosphate kinase